MWHDGCFQPTKRNKLFHKCTEMQYSSNNLNRESILWSNVISRQCVFYRFLAFFCIFSSSFFLHNTTPLNTPKPGHFCALVLKINSGKLIQFIAFTYWPESLRQGGIMADWVCLKTEEEGGDGGRKENVCKKTHQGDKMLQTAQTRGCLLKKKKSFK